MCLKRGGDRCLARRLASGEAGRWWRSVWVLAAVLGGAAIPAGADGTPGATDAVNYERLVRDTAGLLAYYRFEQAEGAARDVGGGRRDAAVEGDVRYGVDPAYAGLGKAAGIAGGGHLRLAAMGTHDAVSIELWLRLHKLPGSSIAAIYAGDGWQAQYVHFNLKQSGALELAVNGADSYPNTAPQTLTPGQWVYVAATYDRGTGVQRIYRNGRLIHSATTSARPAVQLGPAAVGVWLQSDPERPLDADIDELAIYSVALTPAQVQARYLAARGIVLRSVDFAADVRPLLARHCSKCHGPDEQKGDLRLDVRDWAMRGGESGEPAIAAFNAEGSHLIRLVSATDKDQRMPRKGEALSKAQVELLSQWIDQGAPWPDALAGHATRATVTTKHWSFQPIVKARPPASEHVFVTTGNAIDAFVLARLREKGLEPSPRADRRTLIRRLYLDVQGLPPTPQEIAAFERDAAPDAWDRLVDRVLASPRYGERWASHWLDVIRYGDTHGFEVNTPRPNAWPYRDYVIQSLNQDKPYDRFVMEQIAGDQLGVDCATGLLVAAPALLQGQVGKDLPSIRQARSDELHEMIVTVGAGIMGLTVGCARCHNHKFDPLSQRDYYQFQAIFAGVHYGDRPVRDPMEVRLGSAANTPVKAVFGGTFQSPGPTYRLYRGNPMQRREQVAPDVPAVLGTLGLESTTPEAQRRVALAKWLVEPSNPLTPRVMVNRMWQHHFGRGLAATPSDFGALGVPPTHPQLLDWLAATFIERGWSMKQMHRIMLQSNTYCQSSRPRADGMKADAGSTWLWRHPPRRLDMEPIRDSILAVSGSLDLGMGGPGFELFKPNTNYVRVYEPKEQWGPGEWRRMIYAHRVRMEQDGVFGAFDCPDAGQPAPRRGRSTTALQALNLLNSGFMQQQADRLAARVTAEAGDDPDAQLTRAFALALGREPNDRERRAARQTASETGLAAVCLALFNCNEFVFIP